MEILDMKNAINKVKKNVETVKNRANFMEDRISELENRNLEMLQLEEKRELRFLKSEEILQEISDSIRKSNMRIIGIPEREKSRELVQRNNSRECLKPGEETRHSLLLFL